MAAQLRSAASAIAAGVLATGMALLGPETVARRILKRFATPLAARAIAYLRVRLALDGETSTLAQAAVGGLGLMAAIDLVVANAASWQPLVPDYTRFARSVRGAAAGVGVGFGVAGAATLAVGVPVTAGALAVSLDRFFDFLYLLGSVFVPLFGAVYADRIRPPAPLGTLVAWIAGFFLYQWLSPTRILGVADHLHPLLDGAVGATLPAFLLAALVRLAWPSRR